MKRIKIEEEDYNPQTEIPNRVVLDVEDSEADAFIEKKSKKFKKAKSEKKASKKKSKKDKK